MKHRMRTLHTAWALALLIIPPAARAQDTTRPSAVLQAPAQIVRGQSLQLSGANSFDPAPGRIARYRWTHLSGAGGGMPLNVTFETTVPSLVVPHLVGNPLAAGAHQFSLVVIDEAGNASNAQLVQVTVQDYLPTAVLSAPGQVIVGQPWALSGASSFDVGGSIVRYVWTRTEGPADSRMPVGQPVATTENRLALGSGGFTVLAIGTHRFSLVVTDDAGNQSNADQRLVTVVADPAPTAVIQAPREIAYGSTLQMSGADSFDVAPGRVIRWTWMRLSGKGGLLALNQPVVMTVAGYTVPQSRDNLLAPGTHQFSLAVTDDAGNRSNAQLVSVTVLPP